LPSAAVIAKFATGVPDHYVPIWLATASFPGADIAAVQFENLETKIAFIF